jgi:hypothetical protein
MQMPSSPTQPESSSSSPTDGSNSNISPLSAHMNSFQSRLSVLMQNPNKQTRVARPTLSENEQ